MRIRLYNTLTRSKVDFVPLDPDNVRLYVCGPTVYDQAHIGNARPVIVFDMLFRLLRYGAASGAWDEGRGKTRVTYVRNITDVDDKINRRAFERWDRVRPLNEEIRVLTEETARVFHEDVAALGCLAPTYEPRATAFVSAPAERIDMIRLIERLIARGHAYVAENHVLFSVPSMPDYGRLSRRSLDEMLAGARVDVAPYKRDPMDFVLWKPSDPATEPGWDSPWGLGRPGWHIECSAMAGALLGEEFDIHGGGIDLMFPHHENEIAQSTCAFGHPLMARIFMHNGFLQVEGRKMSKSEGNFVTIRELLSTDRFGGRSWHGQALRLAMLKTHYRQPIDWTVRALEEAEATLLKWRYLIERSGSSSRGQAALPDDQVIEALADDLNSAQALARLNQMAKEAVASGEAAAFARTLDFLGFSASHVEIRRHMERPRIGSTVKAALPSDLAHDMIDDKWVESRIADRLAARRAKDFATSDRIRDELAAMGIQLKDGKDAATGEPTCEIQR